MSAEIEGAKPLLLVDIDGVLNPHLQRGIELPSHFQLYQVGGQRVHLSGLHGKWLRALSDNYDLVWATTWEADANAPIAPLIGAPDDLPYISFTDRDADDWTWKLPAVDAFVGDRPVAWLDDDPGEGADAWAAQRPVATRLLIPDRHLGWRWDEYERLITFAKELS